MAKRGALMAARNGAIPVVQALNDVRLVWPSPFGNESGRITNWCVVADPEAFSEAISGTAEALLSSITLEVSCVDVVSAIRHLSLVANNKSEWRSFGLCHRQHDQGAQKTLAPIRNELLSVCPLAWTQPSVQTLWEA